MGVTRDDGELQPVEGAEPHIRQQHIERIDAQPLPGLFGPTWCVGPWELRRTAYRLGLPATASARMARASDGGW